RKIGSAGIAYGFDVKVVDADGRDVERGGTGEILVSGASIMKGYYGHCDAGAGISADRFLSTGDIGRQDEDGFIFIVGRKNDVINKGGEKVAPREIEELLVCHPDVLECAVVGVGDPVWGQEAVAFVVLKDGRQCSWETLSSFCMSEVGPLKTPGRISFLDSLPRGTAHKINRVALTALAESANSAAVPCSEIIDFSAAERVVIDSMRELLSMPEMNPRHNFFDCGGYSLRALMLVNCLSQHFHRTIPVAALFCHPTASELAAYIVSAAKTNRHFESSNKSLVPIKPGGRLPPIFLTPGGKGSDQDFLAYAVLARHFDPDQPLYGLKARSSMKGATAHATVELMAADYLAEIREIQSTGPYHLIGECSGGVVAYEMARQLVRAGEQVAFLALLDCRAPDLLYELSE
ncbi:MAG: thioesterase domain-containing protein, partial [Terriglobales bacterium]